MGGDKGGGNTTVSNELPPELRPLAQTIASTGRTGLQGALEQYNNPRSLPGFSLTTPLDPSTLSALGGAERFGGAAQQNLFGPQLTDATQQQLLGTQRGDFLLGGPAQAAALAELRNIIPGINSQFAGAGRLNSGLAETAVSQATADALARQYGDERQRQIQAAQLSPMLAQQDIGELGALETAGRAREAQSMRELDERIRRFQFPQEEPRQRIDELLRASTLSPGLGQFGSTQTTSGGGPGAFQSALGGAGTGFALGNAIFPGVGGIVGAGIGGLGGLLL